MVIDQPSLEKSLNNFIWRNKEAKMILSESLTKDGKMSLSFSRYYH